MELLYDVAHNMAKIEEHEVDGQLRPLCVHRKGATRAFPAGHPDVPACYRDVGQPVIIPGDMGRASWVLRGGPRALERTFGTTCHGAGRVKSRSKSMRTTDPAKLLADLKGKGITVMAKGKRTVAEEAPDAYKDINRVVEVVHRAGISRKVARLRPLCVIKG